MASQILTHAIGLGYPIGLGYALYKAKTDPIHIFWGEDDMCIINSNLAN